MSKKVYENDFLTETEIQMKFSSERVINPIVNGIMNIKNLNLGGIEDTQYMFNRVLEKLKDNIAVDTFDLFYEVAKHLQKRKMFLTKKDIIEKEKENESNQTNQTPTSGNA